MTTNRIARTLVELEIQARKALWERMERIAQNSKPRTQGSTVLQKS